MTSSFVPLFLPGATRTNQSIPQVTPLRARRVAAALSAVCLPAVSRLRLFPGAADLLASIKDHGLPCVICSNAMWRNAAAYWRDLHSLGIAERIDAVVSSA
jgi:FMN phosphatase YigB (HAD superfamily)